MSLVQQLKAGKMTKEELFDQLSRIQKAKRSEGAPSAKHAEPRHAGSAHDTADLLSPDGAAYRSPDEVAPRPDEEELLRRAKMQYGAQHRREPPGPAGRLSGRDVGGKQGLVSALQQPPEMSMEDDDFDRQDEGSFEFERMSSGLEAEDIEAQQRLRSNGQSRGHQHSPAPRDHAWGTPRQGMSAPPPRPHSAEPAARRQAAAAVGAGRTRAPSPSPRTGYAGAGFGGAPNARGRQMPKTREFEFATAKRGADHRTMERMRQIEQERLAQCTFRPQIQRSTGPDYVKASSVSSSRPSDLYERQLAWAKRKEQQMEEDRLELQRERERECTFQPKINPIPEVWGYSFSSHPQREASYDRSTAMTVHSSYAAGSQGSASRRPPPVRVDPNALTDRLYNQGIEHKRHMQEKLRERLQEEMQKMCTFSPAVNPEGRVRDPTPVRARYLDSTPRKNDSAMDSVIAQEERDLAECTFKPGVMEVWSGGRVCGCGLDGGGNVSVCGKGQGSE